jgi:hypothetical protein
MLTCVLVVEGNLLLYEKSVLQAFLCRNGRAIVGNEVESFHDWHEAFHEVVRRLHGR